MRATLRSAQRTCRYVVSLNTKLDGDCREVEEIGVQQKQRRHMVSMPLTRAPIVSSQVSQWTVAIVMARGARCLDLLAGDVSGVIADVAGS